MTELGNTPASTSLSNQALQRTSTFAFLVRQLVQMQNTFFPGSIVSRATNRPESSKIRTSLDRNPTEMLRIECLCLGPMHSGLSGEPGKQGSGPIISTQPMSNLKSKTDSHSPQVRSSFQDISHQALASTRVGAIFFTVGAFGGGPILASHKLVAMPLFLVAPLLLVVWPGAPMSMQSGGQEAQIGIFVNVLMKNTRRLMLESIEKLVFLLSARLIPHACPATFI